MFQVVVISHVFLLQVGDLEMYKSVVKEMLLLVSSREVEPHHAPEKQKEIEVLGGDTKSGSEYKRGYWEGCTRVRAMAPLSKAGECVL